MAVLVLYRFLVLGYGMWIFYADTGRTGANRMQYIMYNSNYWLNLNEMWTNFPTREMDGLLKWYYLVQYAFWLQQILVVHIEERRKDHWQMFTHHLVTCTLLFTSYGYYQTKVGNVILCLMDVVDLVFPVSPCFFSPRAIIVSNNISGSKNAEVHGLPDSV